jgi:smad nuclear-interacting protein 1
MDLESTNGTFLNNDKVDPSRYTELLHGDMLKFGLSQREYIMVKSEGQNNAGEDDE